MMYGSVHSRAAAKATAALDRPDPGHRAAPATTATTGTLTITGMIGTSHPTVTTASTTAGSCRGGAKGGGNHGRYTHLGENIIVHSLII